MKRIVLRIVLAIVVLLLILAAVAIALNRSNTDFSDLNDTDQQILLEFDAFCKANAENAIWQGFDLENKTVLAIGGMLKNAYLINPSAEINNLYAAKIDMPQDSVLNVYHISFLTPQTYLTRFEFGNFNTLGKTYNVFGDEVYFIRYNRGDSIEAVNSSRHFITFLTHEAFHYYMQSQWVDGSRFAGDLSDTDINLLAEEYDALAGIQAELQNDVSNPVRSFCSMQGTMSALWNADWPQTRNMCRRNSKWKP